jgi:hypothetical protein
MRIFVYVHLQQCASTRGVGLQNINIVFTFYNNKNADTIRPDVQKGYLLILPDGTTFLH